MAKNKMKKTNTIHFGIQRKIVANMTTESWANVPHVTYNYEPDVTEFMIEYKRLNEDCPPEKKVTLNTLMLKIIVEGLKADPIMNSHIEFDRKLVRGEIHTFENIDISMPMVLPSGEMMTINLHNFENKNLDEMVSYIADVNRRVANTNLDEVMFDVSLDNTLTALKQGKIKQTLYRLIGSKTGKHKVKTLSGKEKSNYYKIPENDRLTKHDIEQGTITVSNIGSVYRAQRGETCLLEIVPPQVCAIAVGAVQDKPVVVVNEAGEKEIAIRQVMPLCIAFDHRALDFGEIVPFIKRLDEIFAAPEIIHTWRNTGISEEHMAEIKVEREQREAKYEQSKEREKARKDAEKAERDAAEKAEKARREAEKAKIEAVVDHHRINNFKTSEPLFYYAQPVGCTSTVLFELYNTNNIKIEQQIAGLMLSAIISDTLLLKSPTTTDKDKKAVAELVNIAGVDLSKYGLDMLKAGTNLDKYTEKELINLDAKTMEKEDVKYIIAQVNTVSIPDVLKRKEKIEAEINKEIEEKGLCLFVFVITDIVNSNSTAIVLGNRTDAVSKTYEIKDNLAEMPGVVSRKKQVLPLVEKNM